VVSLVAGVLMMALMYVPTGIDQTWLHLLLFAVATPILFWAGAGFYRAAEIAQQFLTRQE